ncbi:hypothetical protein GCM10007036_26220 [Alsobacter metallidurans]|uniref:Uncharacterized protein n=1 Tax=Alsobacter metallidurans TaxID=340221 RepID=A0A917I888_9HYPH|nr:hypothetical protein GCM10007036_26220 [Alsobacter metallidurans]
MPLREAVAHERPEREPARHLRLDGRALANRDQLQEHSRKLHDAVLGPPRVSITGANREAKRLIEAPSGVEIVDGENEMVEAAGHWGAFQGVKAA